MLLLDEEDNPPAAAPSPPPPKAEEKKARRGFSLRPLLTAVMVAVLGSGLGLAAYFATSMDVKDVIGLFDVADTRPQLQLDLANLMKGAPPIIAPPPIAQPSADSPIQPKADGGEAAGVGNLPPTPTFKDPTKTEQGKPDLPPKPDLPSRPDGLPALPALPTDGPSLSGLPSIPALAPAAAGPGIPTEPPPSAAAPSPVLGGLATPAPLSAKSLAPAEPALPQPRALADAPSYTSLPPRRSKPTPLPAAPMADLISKGLPVIAADGRSSARVYAAPFASIKPRVAVIVTGLGMDRDGTDTAITRMPPEVTLALSPYAGAAEVVVRQARDRGHEVMLGLATETAGFPARDPGPLGLLISNPEAENIARLNRTLSKAVGYVGVWAPDGPFAVSPQMGTVLKTLKDRGLLFIGPGEQGDTTPAMAPVTTVIDADTFREAIDARLETAVKVAQDKGRAVILVTPRPLIYDRLLAWFETLDQRGVVLAPAASIVLGGSGK